MKFFKILTLCSLYYWCEFVLHLWVFIILICYIHMFCFLSCINFIFTLHSRIIRKPVYFSISLASWFLLVIPGCVWALGGYYLWQDVWKSGYGPQFGECKQGDKAHGESPTTKRLLSVLTPRGTLITLCLSLPSCSYPLNALHAHG